MFKYVTLFILIVGVFMNTLPLPLTAADEPRYELLHQGIIPKTKASIDIQVSKKLTKLELSQAARTLRQTLCENAAKIGSCPDVFPKIYITWYLPGMEQGAGAWATTHFEPELDVKIMDWMLEYNPTTIE